MSFSLSAKTRNSFTLDKEGHIPSLSSHVARAKAKISQLQYHVQNSHQVERGLPMTTDEVDSTRRKEQSDSTTQREIPIIDLIP